MTIGVAVKYKRLHPKETDQKHGIIMISDRRLTWDDDQRLSDQLMPESIRAPHRALKINEMR